MKSDNKAIPSIKTDIADVLTGFGIILMIPVVPTMIIASPLVQGMGFVQSLGEILLKTPWIFNIWNWIIGVNPAMWHIMACTPFVMAGLGFLIRLLPKGDDRVNRLPTGLDPECADLAMERLAELTDSCQDAFSKEPGVRLQHAVVNTEGALLPQKTERILQWNLDNEIYIDEVIDDPIHLKMDNGVAYIEDKYMGYHELMRNKPYPIARKNRDGKIISKSYITWLGGN